MNETLFVVSSTFLHLSYNGVVKRKQTFLYDLIQGSLPTAQSLYSVQVEEAKRLSQILYDFGTVKYDSLYSSLSITMEEGDQVEFITKLYEPCILGNGVVTAFADISTAAIQWQTTLRRKNNVITRQGSAN